MKPISSKFLFNIILVILLSPQIFCRVQNPLYPPDDFFSSVDVTTVTWAHGVNSVQALEEALADPSIRMIEADLVRGRLNVSGELSPWDLAIMAHPPQNTSDLSFVSFIDQIIAFNANKSLENMKGVKLDFKDYFAAARSTVALSLRNRTGTIQFPVWLNADVVKGPANSTSEPKVKGAELLQLQAANLPNAVLSLGWTTRFDASEPVQGYTREQMDDMIKVFSNYSTDPEVISKIPVTFAVRAVFAQHSLENFLYLMNATSHRASLTFWTGATDPKVNVTLLDDFFKVVGKQSIFIDLPYTDWEVNSGSNVVYSFIFIAFSSFVRYLICKLCEENNFY